jgi:anti-anti-sigma factor
MRLNLLPGDGMITRLECAEDLTLLEVHAAGDALAGLLGPGCYARTVLLDLGRASYIDSAGVGWLVMCHKRFRDAGGCLVLHSLPPLAVHVFAILGLDSVLHLAGNEAAARALASSAAKARGRPSAPAAGPGRPTRPAHPL